MRSKDPTTRTKVKMTTKDWAESYCASIKLCHISCPSDHSSRQKKWPTAEFYGCRDWLKTGHVVWSQEFDWTIPPSILSSVDQLFWRVLSRVWVELLYFYLHILQFFARLSVSLSLLINKHRLVVWQRSLIYHYHGWKVARKFYSNDEWRTEVD